MVASADEQLRRPRFSRWFARRDGEHSPADFIEFMAVGGATLVLLPLALVATRILGREPAEYGVGFITFYAAYVVNDPHFATTYVLFYSGVRRRFAALNLAQRVRYVVAGLVVPWC